MSIATEERPQSRGEDERLRRLSRLRERRASLAFDTRDDPVRGVVDGKAGRLEDVQHGQSIRYGTCEHAAWLEDWIERLEQRR